MSDSLKQYEAQLCPNKIKNRNTIIIIIIISKHTYTHMIEGVAYFSKVDLITRKHSIPHLLHSTTSSLMVMEKKQFKSVFSLEILIQVVWGCNTYIYIYVHLYCTCNYFLHQKNVYTKNVCVTSLSRSSIVFSLMTFFE